MPPQGPLHDLSIELADQPSPDELSIVERGLAEHGESRSEPRNARALVLFLRDARSDVVGGLRAVTVWGWLEIKWLWIAEPHRGRGCGRRLVAAAEREAIGRGCRHAWLDTFDFQAPQFYARLGYDVFAALDDFPRGHTRYFLRKMTLQP
jgi:GNAT superfamily N-acetyltransferase